LDIKPNTIASIEGIIPRPQQQANRNDDIPSTNDAIAKPLVFAYCCSLTLTYALYSLSTVIVGTVQKRSALAACTGKIFI